MARGPTWRARLNKEGTEAEVVRVARSRGYPEPPHAEGRISYPTRKLEVLLRAARGCPDTHGVWFYVGPSDVLSRPHMTLGDVRLFGCFFQPVAPPSKEKNDG